MPKLIKVLHVLPRLSVGGITTWLSRVYRHMDRERFHFDFAVHRPSYGPYAGEFLDSGSRVFTLPNRKNVFRYLLALRRILRANGPYDVVHAHYHEFSGLVLAMADMTGVPVRIAHSRTTSDPTGSASFVARLTSHASRMLLARVATVAAACSSKAALSLFGADCEVRSRTPLFVLPGGIDISPFVSTVPTKDLRRQLAIGPESLVIGHVGNFLKPKNHGFLLDVFAEIVRRRPDSLLVLVGEGELKSAIYEEPLHNPALISIIASWLGAKGKDIRNRLTLRADGDYGKSESQGAADVGYGRFRRDAKTHPAA